MNDKIQMIDSSDVTKTEVTKEKNGNFSQL